VENPTPVSGGDGCALFKTDRVSGAGFFFRRGGIWELGRGKLPPIRPVAILMNLSECLYMKESFFFLLLCVLF
jgi:hypothetical protein